MCCGAIRGINSETEVRVATDFNDVKKQIFSYTVKFSKYVTPSWWSQLFLQASDDMYIAELSHSDTVDRIEAITASALLQEYEVVLTVSLGSFNQIKYNFVYRKNGQSQRMSFLNLLVEFIILRMTFINCPHTVYKFEFFPQINESIQYSVHKGRNEFTFLTDGYVNLFKDF